MHFMLSVVVQATNGPILNVQINNANANANANAIGSGAGAGGRGSGLVGTAECRGDCWAM